MCASSFVPSPNTPVQFLFLFTAKMASLDDKLRQLEEATTASHSALLEKQSELHSKAEALDAAKVRLKALSPQAQENLEVNETELPELIEAKMAAQAEYDEAKCRCETNQKYLQLLKEKIANS